MFMLYVYISAYKPLWNLTVWKMKFNRQIRIIEGNFDTLDEDLRVGPKTACIISVRVQYLRLHINFENLSENYFLQQVWI